MSRETRKWMIWVRIDNTLLRSLFLAIRFSLALPLSLAFPIPLSLPLSRYPTLSLSRFFSPEGSTSQAKGTDVRMYGRTAKDAAFIVDVIALCFSCTSVACETGFSYMNLIHYKFRYRMYRDHIKRQMHVIINFLSLHSFDVKQAAYNFDSSRCRRKLFFC